MIDVIATEYFLRELKQLAKRHRSIKADVRKLEDRLKENPLEGTDIGRNMRKLRMAISSKQQGKSGGARVITHVIVEVEDTTVRLLTIYDKSDKESLSEDELRELLKKNGLL